MNRLAIRVLMGVLLALLVVAPVFAAVTWNISDSYSSSANPNGVWTYGSRAAVEASDLTAFPAHSYFNFWSSTWEVIAGESTSGEPHSAIEAWHSSTTSWDGITRYLTSTADCWGFLHRASGDIAVAGAPGAAGVMRFIVPVTGNYTVAASFTQPDDRYVQPEAGTISNVHVLKNGVSQGTGAIQAYGDTYAYPSTQWALQKNDTIEFASDNTKSALVSGSIVGDVTLPVVGDITGKVAFADYTGDKTEILVKIELLQGATVISTQKTTLPATGSFTISSVAPGTYSVRIKAACWLRKAVPVTVNNNVDVGTVTLTNGDVNGDNRIDTPDFSIVSGNFDQVGN